MKPDKPAPIVTMCDPTQPANEPDMPFADIISPAEAAPSIDDRIHAFLDGGTLGEELLHALYDHVLDEPIPARMLAVLRK
jgi:hypothetical protein